MNKLENTKVLRYAKKIKSINYLGGKCITCGEKNLFKLTFHHRNPQEKEFSYSTYREYRWSKLKEELDKCDILCQNCHRELHYDIILKHEPDRRKDKSIYLEYSGGKCIKCGYNKCLAAIGFHHRNPEEKEFWIGGLSERMNSVSDLRDIIKNEIDKCDVLCQNCHTLEHSDIDFFNENKDIIYERLNKHKEVQPKIDRNEVKRMYNSGIRQIDISKHFNVNKSTICLIIKELKIKEYI
jgi:hypothetical protein